MEKKFVRILSALLLSAVMAIGLVACGGNSKSESNTESESKVSETETVSTEETGEAENKDTDNAESIVDTEDPTDIAGKTVYYTGWYDQFSVNIEHAFSVKCPEGFTADEPNVFSEADIANAPGGASWRNGGGALLTIGYNCPMEAYELNVPEGDDEIVVGSRKCTVTTSKLDESDNGFYKYNVYVPADTAVYVIQATFIPSDEYFSLPYDGDVIKEIINSITPL